MVFRLVRTLPGRGERRPPRCGFRGRTGAPWRLLVRGPGPVPGCVPLGFLPKQQRCVFGLPRRTVPGLTWRPERGGGDEPNLASGGARGLRRPASPGRGLLARLEGVASTERALPRGARFRPRHRL